jgi:hypothetical protein
MKLGTHIPDGERGKSIDIAVYRTKVKATTCKNITKIRYFFLFPHDIFGERGYNKILVTHQRCESRVANI